MKVRSPTLLTVALLLLGSATTLGILRHDGVVGTDSVAAVSPGDEVTVKGEMTPYRAPTILPHWRFLEPLFDGQTYLMESEPGMKVLVTHGPEGLGPDVVVVGDVAFVGPSPDGSGRTLVVIQGNEWSEPILFR